MDFYLFLFKEEKEKLRKKKHLDFVDSLLEAKVMEQIECSKFLAVLHSHPL